MHTRIYKLLSLLVIVVIIALAIFIYPKYFNNLIKSINPNFLGFPEKEFRLGLDLQGGAELLYQADLTGIKTEDIGAAMDGLRAVIEKRIDIFGVREPEIKIMGDNRVSVQLAGIKDPNEAVKEIGRTPYLVFMEPKENYEEILEINQKALEEQDYDKMQDPFTPTDLTGRYLKKAQLNFNPQTSEPVVSLEFNDEGSKLFEELTKNNLQKPLAIFIDDELISAPIVQDVIVGGSAQITGKFTDKEAKELATNLNSGALPVPITLISQKSVGATLGIESVKASMIAGAIGLIAIIIFMIIYYRASGFLASLALLFYGVLILSIFKIIPVTMTLAGIGGFVLSIGMAVDANILIFSRVKEELREDKEIGSAIKSGFSRAWPSIRDGNLTTLLVALILFNFGTSFVKGFATTLMIGVVISMFSAIIITRILMLAMTQTRFGKIKRIWR
ncbi:MAG: protein translocase subunit SecD [Candidatus Pacebacteria bacterium]|nr:protein translocase subunit SecD [Candidatus Paceibacterota bacterium]MDD5621021.1 protein translocase subunit SecD [Candidatus Paceibacterota bacterium]